MSRKAMVATVVAAVLLVGVGGLAVFFASQTGGPPSSSPSPDPAGADSPSPSPTHTEDESSGPSDAAWLIGFGRIGPVASGMTPDVAAAAAGVTDTAPWFADKTFAPNCAQFTLDETGPGAAVVALATSAGDHGPIDRLSVYGSAIAGLDPAVIPRTEEGLGVGSTESQVKDVYGDELVEEAGAFQPETSTYLTVTDSTGMAIRFEVTSGVVTAIHSGTAEAVRLVEGCA